MLTAKMDSRHQVQNAWRLSVTSFLEKKDPDHLAWSVDRHGRTFDCSTRFLLSFIPAGECHRRFDRSGEWRGDTPTGFEGFAGQTRKATNVVAAANHSCIRCWQY